MSQNLIDAAGIQIKAVSDIVSEILNGSGIYPGFYAIYGADINVGPNSPDGQMINIIAQVVVDEEEFLATIYNSFDPDLAFGVTLDLRCAINGVVRMGGTNTTVGITVVVSQGVTLPGLDVNPLSGAFTIVDSQGNQYQLQDTYIFTGGGSAVLIFQAVNTGPINPAPGTINTPVTILLGVTSVTNVSAPITVGETGETDAQLRIRRSNSTSLPSKGYLQGLYGALLAVPGVTQAEVLENDTGTTDGNGIPGHSIWVIVVGGTSADVAQAIYVKRNAGCGMKGSITVAVMQVDGSSFNIKFDRATEEDLYVEFNITAITGGFDPVFLAAQIRATFVNYKIGASAAASPIMAFVQGIYPNCYTDSEGVSTDGTSYAAVKAPTGVNYIFAILPGSGGVKINGTSY